MDILFKNSFTLTEKIILECRVAFTKKWGKFFSLLGLIMTLFEFIRFYSVMNFKYKFIFTLFLFFFIYMLFFLPILRAKKMYKRYLIVHNYRPIQESIDFYDDIFKVYEPNGAIVSLSYNNIKKIYNKKNMLVLLCKGDLLVFIKKDGFEHGTYNDFKNFILSKSNLRF